MVLDKLGSSLKATLAKISKAIFVDDALIGELTKELQRSLLSSDVNVKLVLALTDTIKKRIKEEKTPRGLTKREHLITILYEELVKFLGGEKTEVLLGDKKPNKILMVGLFGSGKTTTTGKLAKYFSKRGKKVAVIGLDVWRPAAMDQLQQVAKAINIPCFTDKSLKDPIKIYEKFEKEYQNYDLLIIDTAGRDALNNELVAEIESITKKVKPDEVFLIISADIGQAAQSQAEQFHKSCGVTGVIATKMEGTAKAGGALSACAVTAAPIKFIGVGEKVDDLEHFNPKGFVSRLLGMGDLDLLLEKAHDAMSGKDAEDMGKKLLKGDFNLIDLHEQMSAMRKMGPLSKIMEMIPGMGQLPIPKEALAGQEVKLDRWKHIMNSCTKKELEDPELIDSSRMKRIAQGSGVPESEIRDMLKQFRQSKKMVKMLKGGSPEKLMQKMQKGMKLR